MYAQDIPLDSIYKRSDIVFTVAQSGTVYNQFNADMVSWGWLPIPLTPDKISDWKGTVNGVRFYGVRYQGRVEIDAGWKNMLDYDRTGFEDDIITTLGGTKLVSPWFAGRYHYGYPAYWFCTNSEGFRDFLRYQVSVVVSGEVNSIMFDGQTGAAQAVKSAGGCFCDYCTVGFKAFMQEKYSAQELQIKGISDIETFHYGDYLKAKGWSESSYKNESGKTNPGIPLFTDFQEYQYRSLSRLTSDLSYYADSLAGKPVVFSSSSNPDQYHRSVFVPEVAYYTQEMHQQASSLKVPFDPVLNYTMAEALGKGMDLTGIPQWDWNVMFEKDRPALVRTWIVQAYAYGARFMVPIWNWAGGTDYYYGKPYDYEYIYDFIHKHSELFDGYNLSAQVGLIMPYEGLRYGSNIINAAIREMIEQNIPFQLVISGSKWWDRELDEFELKRSMAIAVTSDSKYLTDREKTMLNRYNARSANASDTADMFTILPRQIDVSTGNEKVTVVPRVNPDSPDVPYVIHLVNRQYNESVIAMDTVRDFKVSFMNSLFNRKIISATLLRPGNDSLELVMDSIEGGFIVEIPELVQWGLIRLKSNPTSKLTFRIYGKSDSGEASLLPEAEIRTNRNFVKTGPGGEVAIRQVPGEITYSIDKKGYAPTDGTFSFIHDSILLDTLDYTTYNMTIHVTDDLSGEDLPDVEVSYGELSGTTDGSGMVVFSGLEYGTLSLSMARDHYSTYRLESLEVFSDTTMGFSLSRNNYLARFHVVDSLNGSELQGVDVWFDQKYRYTGPDGKVAISAPFGEREFTMALEDYDTIHGSLSLMADTILMLQMRRIWSSVAFRVKNNGASVYKAVVTLNSISKETNTVGMVGFNEVPVFELLGYNVSKDGFKLVEGNLYLIGDTTVQVNLSGVGIEDKLSGEIYIYPNPAKEKLFIAGPDDEMSVELMDMTGRIMISRSLARKENKLLLGAIPPGVYLLKVTGEDSKTWFFRIVRE